MKDLITQLVGMAMDHNGGRLPYMANRGDAWDASKDWVYYSGPYWNHLEVEASISSIAVSRENSESFVTTGSKKRPPRPLWS